MGLQSQGSISLLLPPQVEAPTAGAAEAARLHAGNIHGQHAEPCGSYHSGHEHGTAIYEGPGQPNARCGKRAGAGLMSAAPSANEGQRAGLWRSAGSALPATMTFSVASCRSPGEQQLLLRQHQHWPRRL